MISKLFQFFVVLIVLPCTCSDSVALTNVAFVIDDTGSMQPVINQVRNKVKQMFNAIYSSRRASIGNFILVRFNDYNVYSPMGNYDDYSLQPIKGPYATKDPIEFDNILSQISAFGGGDCPELCLTGIQKAIEACSPNSVIFVFTDASPRDQHLQQTVVSLALQKSIQISFLLVFGLSCPLDDTVYGELANATSGEVFRLHQNDIEEVLNYVTYSTQGSHVPLMKVPLKPGSNCFNISSDKGMDSISINIVVDPNAVVDVTVTGQDGNKTDSQPLVNTTNTQVIVIPNPGNQTLIATVNTNGTGQASVKADVTVNFKLGFSTWIPTSLKNTKSGPVPDEDSYLTIQLELTGTVDAELESIHILDINDEELMNMSANVVNKNEKIYVSSPFKPPNQIFNVKIVVIDPQTKEKYNRTSRVPIQPQQRPKPGLVVQKRPEVTIENSPKISVEIGKSVTLECKVNAYPKPTIVWEDLTSGLEWPSKVLIWDLPYEYMSRLEIKNAEKTGSYKCKANSSLDDVIEASIQVETFKPRYLKILEAPKDTQINYEKDGKVNCKIDAWPPGHVAWYKGDKELANDDDFEISSDKSSLLVKKMQLNLEGKYSCKATNEDNSTVLDFTLSLSGLEPPELDKTVTVITVAEGSPAIIPCRILKGVPEPEISWEYKRNGNDGFYSIPGKGKNITITSSNERNAGVYRCFAKNIAGNDSHETELIIHYPPVILKLANVMTAIRGEKAVIQCQIWRALPPAAITWEFKRQNAKQFVSFVETTAEIPIDPVTEAHSGIYKCHAKNNVGEDSFEIELTVYSAPTVAVEGPLKVVKSGDTVTLSCSVGGVPKPAVTWKKNNINIQPDNKYKIFGDNSLRFTASLDDVGNFICEAENSVGRKFDSTYLVIYAPIELTPPEETPIYVDVGSKVNLLCKAVGVPQVTLSWQFWNKKPDSTPRVLKCVNEILNIDTIQSNQAGYYTCTARNSFDEKTITYEVIVYVPAEIEYPEQTDFVIVKHDFVLRIPCKAKGYPEPKVSWTKNYRKLTNGDTYETEPDGTLVIKNPDETVAGSYLCIAENSKTSRPALQVFTVKVSPTLLPSHPTETIYIVKGTSREIKCKLPHKSADKIRWYKGGVELPTKTNVLSLRQARVSDSDIYSCRVNSLQGSQSAHLKIEVGAKPEFENKKPDVIVLPYGFGRNSRLNCKVTGNPTPQITWWYNGSKEMETSDSYTINRIIESHLGEYRCEAKNNFGSVSRTYVLKVAGCKINYAEKERNKFHPVLFLKSGELPQFENEDGVMVVREDDPIYILCPNSIREAYCNNDNYIIIDSKLSLEDRKFQYPSLKCDSEVEPIVGEYSLKNIACSENPESRLIQVGYKHHGSFYAVYDICMDLRARRQIFVKYDITPQASNVKIDTHPFVGTFMDYDYDDMFDCSKQRVKEGCCFYGRQIVSPQDVIPGVQKTTYLNINVVPHWNFCGNKLNVDEIERRIRDLAKSTQNKIQVFGGKHGHQEMILYGRYGHSMDVPKYIWKLVQIPEIDQALAIVTINVPNLTAEEARALVFCQDRCDATDWMSNSDWINVQNGYTFCCDPWEFADQINPFFKQIFASNLILSKKIK